MADVSDAAAQCQKLAAMGEGNPDETFRKCMCMISPSGEPCLATRLLAIR